jgi:hypothetical protein
MSRKTALLSVLVITLVLQPRLLVQNSEPFNSEPFNYAELWRSLDKSARRAYLDGVVDGTFNTWKAAGDAWLGSGQLCQKPELPKVRVVREKVFVREQSPQIPAVMSDLYSDSANAYISLIDMVFMARDKLEGENINGALAIARKRALDEHRLNQLIKRQ